MDIQLNGKRTTVPAAATVGELILKKDLDPDAVVVKRILKKRVEESRGARIQGREPET